MKKLVERALGHSAETAYEGWQQFVVLACDERGDGINDYMIEVLSQAPDGQWVVFDAMSTDVHAYRADPSYRCFHVRLPAGLSGGKVKLRVRINASTGTELLAYQGYSSEPRELGSTAEPVEIDLDDLGGGNGSMFCPFTTTLIQIVLNREPMPLDQVSRLLTFLES
jgi:hypothetical protein